MDVHQIHYVVSYNGGLFDRVQDLDGSVEWWEVDNIGLGADSLIEDKDKVAVLESEFQKLPDNQLTIR